MTHIIGLDESVCFFVVVFFGGRGGGYSTVWKIVLATILILRYLVSHLEIVWSVKVHLSVSHTPAQSVFLSGIAASLTDLYWQTWFWGNLNWKVVNNGINQIWMYSRWSSFKVELKPKEKIGQCCQPLLSVHQWLVAVQCKLCIFRVLL